MMIKKIINIWAAKLFVMSIILGMVGWICLFGKDLPMDYVPILYAILGITALASIYVRWKKPELLQNKTIMFGLVIFILIGVRKTSSAPRSNPFLRSSIPASEVM